MATLAEAVASGRRWRHQDWIPRSAWAGPGLAIRSDGEALIFSARFALSSDFEIEPEPVYRTKGQILYAVYKVFFPQCIDFDSSSDQDLGNAMVREARRLHAASGGE